MPSNSAHRYSDRLSSEEECDLARAIRQAEAATQDALAGIDLAVTVLCRPSKRSHHTHAGTVDRLGEAVRAVVQAAETDPSLQDAAGRALEAWKAAERLRWRLAMSCTRIALGEARKLAGPNLEYEDLVQEGYIGLLRAAKRFDPDRGVRFSTYARFWVRAQMTRSTTHAGIPVRIPADAAFQFRQVQQERIRAESAGTPCSDEDLARRLGVSRNRAGLLIDQCKAVSLEACIRTESGASILPHADGPSPDAAVDSLEATKWLRQVLDVLLTERQRYVLNRRYGLTGEELGSFARIGREMELSRERVRQIERDALTCIRSQETGRQVVAP